MQMMHSGRYDHTNNQCKPISFIASLSLVVCSILLTTPPPTVRTDILAAMDAASIHKEIRDGLSASEAITHKVVRESVESFNTAGKLSRKEIGRVAGEIMDPVRKE
jgi:hypothetical protein